MVPDQIRNIFLDQSLYLLQELHLTSGRVVDGFLLPDPGEPVVNRKLLPSLRRLRLEDLYEDDIELLAVRRFHSPSLGDAITCLRMCWTLAIAVDIVLKASMVMSPAKYTTCSPGVCTIKLLLGRGKVSR